MSEFRERRPLVYRGGGRHNSRLMTKCVTRELFKRFGFHRRLYKWKFACVRRLPVGLRFLPSRQVIQTTSAAMEFLCCAVPCRILSVLQEAYQQLVERVQRGDKRAFDLLVLKYQHKILGLIVRFVHDTHEAQDVAQEAFVKAYRALGNFRGDSAFYTWLYRIAINTAKNHLVSRGRRPR